MNNQKFIKTINIIDVLLKIAQVLCGVVIVALLAIGVYVQVAGVQNLATSLDFWELELQIADSAKYINPDLMTKSILLFAAGGIVIVGITIYMLRVFRHILQPMKQGRPFEMSVVKEMKRLAVVILVGGFVGEGLLALVSIVQYRAIDFAALIEGSPITAVTLNQTINPAFIFGALIVYLLSHIFQYGVMLQKESDETL